MGTEMPVLETGRLVIRPFTMDDLDDIHRILDLEAEMEPGTRAERGEWLEWTLRSYAALARLYQPPLGDRAIWRRDDGGPHAGRLVGAVGLVPALGPFGRLPALGGGTPAASASAASAPAASASAASASAAGAAVGADSAADRFTLEMGLFWALGNEFRGQGYATEAARAVVDYALRALNLARVVATTEYDNLASQRVMERLGMTIERNPRQEPAWFQVVGVLESAS